MATPPTKAEDADVAIAANSSKTTASLSVASGHVLVSCGMMEAADLNLNLATMSGGPTFTNQALQDGGTDQTALVRLDAAVGTGTVSAGINQTASGSTLNWALNGSRWTGSDGLGAANSSNNGTGSGAPSFTLTTQAANSAIIACFADWNAADGASRTYPQINSQNAIELYYERNSLAVTVYVVYWPDAGAAGAKTVGITTPNTQRWVGAALEIKGSSGASAAITGTATASITEADIVAGGKTIIATLTGDTYVSDTAAVTFHASSTGVTAVAANPPTMTLTLPTLAADDIIVIHVMSKNIVEASNEINTPSGYTEKGSKVEIDSATAADDMRSAVFWKRAVGGDSGANVTISRAGTDTVGLYAKAYVFRGCVTTGDPFDSFVAGAGDTTADDIVNFPAIDPTASAVHVAYMFVHADDLSTPAASFTNDGTTFDLRAEAETATGTDATMGLYSADRTGAALSAVTTDITATAGSDIGYAFALTPGASAFANARQAIINGLDSGQSEGTGWDAVVKAGEVVGSVVRTSSTVCTITLSAFASYNITAQETITVTLPASALTLASPIVATPTFTVDTATTAVTGTAVITLPKLTASAVGVMLPSGTSVVTLPQLTTTATGTHAQTGTSVATLPQLTTAASGAHAQTGTSVVTLPQLTTAASGTHAQTGTSVVTLPQLTTAATGHMAPSGTSAVTLSVLTATASGAHAQTGTSVVTLPQLTAAAIGVMLPSGTSVVTLPALTAAATGSSGFDGTSTVNLPALTVAATGAHAQTGTSVVTLPQVTAAAAGHMDATGTSVATLPQLTAAATGAHAQTGTSVLTLPALTAAATGEQSTGITGTAEPTLPQLTAAASGTHAQTGTSVVALPAPTATATGAHAQTGTSVVTLPPLTAAATGAHAQTGISVATLPALVATANGAHAQTGTATITLPALTAAATGAMNPTGTATLTLPALTAVAAGLAGVFPGWLSMGDALAYTATLSNALVYVANITDAAVYRADLSIGLVWRAEVEEAAAYMAALGDSQPNA